MAALPPDRSSKPTAPRSKRSAAASESAIGGRVYGGLSPTERAADRRPRFVAAGLDIFGTVGYQSASIRGVCKAAGLTDRYFYEAFDSLEDLLRAVYEHVVDQVWEEIEAAFAQDHRSFADQLHDALLAYFTHIRNPLHARIMLSAVIGVSRTMDEFYRKHMKRFASSVLGKYRANAGISDRPGPTDHITGTAIVGAVVMVATEWAGTGYRVPIGTVTAACTQVVLGAVTRSQPLRNGR